MSADIKIISSSVELLDFLFHCVNYFNLFCV